MCATHILCHWQHVAHNVPHLLLTQSNQNTASFLFQRIQSAVTPGKRRTEPSCSVCCLVMMHHRRDYTSIQSCLHPRVSSTLPRQTFQSVVQVGATESSLFSANNKASSGWNHGMNMVCLCSLPQQLHFYPWCSSASTYQLYVRLASPVQQGIWSKVVAVFSVADRFANSLWYCQ